MKSTTVDTGQQALIEALDGHGLDTMSQDSGQQCLCGSDSRFEQADGDLSWSSLSEHRAQVILASVWLREHDATRLAAATLDAAPAQAKAEASWITGPEQAAQFIAAVAWPWERSENRDEWALKMLVDQDLFALESARAQGRLDAAIATVRVDSSTSA